MWSIANRHVYSMHWQYSIYTTQPKPHTQIAPPPSQHSLPPWAICWGEGRVPTKSDTIHHPASSHPAITVFPYCRHHLPIQPSLSSYMYCTVVTVFSRHHHLPIVPAQSSHTAITIIPPCHYRLPVLPSPSTYTAITIFSSLSSSFYAAHTIFLYSHNVFLYRHHHLPIRSSPSSSCHHLIFL